MFGIGVGEILIVCLVAIVFFGPDDFVKLTRFAAKGLREFRVLKQDLKDSVDRTLDTDARRGKAKPDSEGGDNS